MKYVNTLAIAGALAGLITLVSAAPANALSELEVIDLDVPEFVIRGERFEVSVEVINRGDLVHGTQNAGRAGYMVDIVLSADRNVPIRVAQFSPNFRDDVLVRGGRISNTRDLNQDERQRFEGYRVEVPQDTPIGEYSICAIVDPGDLFSEEVETNNVTCVPVTVLNGPPHVDFAVEFIETQIVCNRGVEKIRLMYNLSNRGTIPSPEVRDNFAWVNLLIDGVGDFGPPIRELVTAQGRPLAPDQQVLRAAAVPPAFAGQQIVATIYADWRQEVDESDENNNAVEVKVNVPDAPCKQ